MKPRTILYSMVAVCAAVFAFSPGHLTAQSDTDSAATAALIKDIQTQQATMADNQKQIDTKLAAINESLRQARIYAGRVK
jgi:septal ring factor EnvC (AmiA/AmiB activator)